MIKVRPIKDRQLLADIQADLARLTDAHGRRVYLLFCVGIYTGLRISDLVGLQVKHVSGQYIRLVEQKTGKETEVIINGVLRDILDERLAGAAGSDWLFPSQKAGPGGQDRHISTRTAADDMHWIKKRYGIDFPFCCHSMRKIYGYWYYKTSGGDIEGLRQYFNHSDVGITKRYICIDRDEVNEMSNRMFLGYRPEKAQRRQTREKLGAAVEIKRLDRAEQGHKWAAAKAKRRAQKDVPHIDAGNQK